MQLSFLVALLPAAQAFPSMMMDRLADPRIRAAVQKRADNATQAISQAETNCGPTPCLTFDPEEQYVSTTGAHAYQSPSVSDIRGPCPGLNAASNHGYLPRNGIANIEQTITGLGQLYGMSVDLAGFLAAYAVIFDGDPILQQWSIGGPPPNVIGGIVGYSPQGISYSHNKYEGDTSIVRHDAYINNGDAHSADPAKFAEAYATCLDDGLCTMDKFRHASYNNQLFSIANNPYYFAPLFSTTLVAPAAYNFIINFMSNRTADNHEGYLDENIFKTFFAMEGTYPNYNWLPGQERIPDNWYRRPSTAQYNAANVIQDLLVGWAAYPDTFRFGGNTNGVNTYEGIDIATLTGGTFDIDGIFEGNNFACLLFQTQQQAVPDFLKGLENAFADGMAVFNKYISPLATQFQCPQLAKYDDSVFDAYPGRNYSPTGPANNYKN